MYNVDLFYRLFFGWPKVGTFLGSVLKTTNYTPSPHQNVANFFAETKNMFFLKKILPEKCVSNIQNICLVYHVFHRLNSLLWATWRCPLPVGPAGDVGTLLDVPMERLKRLTSHREMAISWRTARGPLGDLMTLNYRPLNDAQVLGRGVVPKVDPGEFLVIFNAVICKSEFQQKEKMSKALAS